jgi:hypothetical protein
VLHPIALTSEEKKLGKSSLLFIRNSLNCGRAVDANRAVILLL